MLGGYAESVWSVSNEVEVRLFRVWVALGRRTQGHPCIGVRIQQEERRQTDGELSSLLQG